jgi:transposase
VGSACKRSSPPETTRPVRVCRQAARRVGLLTGCRRRLTASGIQPVGLVQHTFAWLYSDGAVAPTTSARCFLEWPDLHAELCQCCVDALAQALPDSLPLLLVEHRGAHTAPRLRWPANVRPVWLPPYGPELNPIERVWRDVKDTLAWRQCVDLEAPPLYVGDLWQAYQASTLQALTGEAYVWEAINALES